MKKELILIIILIFINFAQARDIDVSVGIFHEDFSTDAYETVYDEAWNGHGCVDCPSEYLSSGSWDGTGFHRIFPPTTIGTGTIPNNGGTNAVSFGLVPNADVVYYGVVVRVGPTYEETAINTGYRIQNKFIILDTNGGGNRGMSIFETNQQTMWMWKEGTYYDPNHVEWDYEQVCHNHVGYDVLQAHTASVGTEPGTSGGASYWQQNLALPCIGGDFSWGYCEDNSCSYDFDSYRSTDYEDEWVYLEIMADEANSIASTSIYTRDGIVSGEIGFRAANYGGQFVSVGVGYFFNGIHTSDPNNYIDIADIYISDSPIGPPSGFVDGSATECNDGVDNDNNGFTDYPDDRGCTSLDDDTEEWSFDFCDNDGNCDLDENCTNCFEDCGSCVIDEDLDGFNSSVDCDDNDSNVSVEVNCSFDGTECGEFSMCVASCPVVPEEICGNGIDEDCDGEDLVCGSFHDADLDENGVVSTSELREYIDLWLGGGKSISQVMGAIRAWVG